MQLVEQHRIDRHDPRFAAIDAAAFTSKHLYNAALYLTRQAFIHERRVIAYEEMARDMKTSEAGVHVGRLAVRASGSGDVKTARGTNEGIHVRYCQPLQRGDDYTDDQKGGALPPQA